MEYLNELSAKGATREDLEVMLRLMAPYAPHFCDEAWEMLGNKGFMLNQKWPDLRRGAYQRRHRYGRSSSKWKIERGVFGAGEFNARSIERCRDGS